MTWQQVITVAASIIGSLATLILGGVALCYRFAGTLRMLIEALHEIKVLSASMNELTGSIKSVCKQQAEFLEQMHKHELRLRDLEAVTDMTPLPKRRHGRD